MANLGYFLVEDSELENIKIEEAKGKIFGKYPLCKKIPKIPHPPKKEKKKNLTKMFVSFTWKMMVCKLFLGQKNNFSHVKIYQKSQYIKEIKKK